MTKAIARDPIYRRRRFQSETIELCVRWYLTYRLSYRDLLEMMAERGVTVSHSTILRWVQRYVPEFEQRWGRYVRRVQSSWRMDETAVSVRGGTPHYHYRAVDKHGKTVDSLLCPAHDLAKRSGIDVPPARTHIFGDDYHTFCVKRFDRTGERRRFYASAMAKDWKLMTSVDPSRLAPGRYRSGKEAMSFREFPS